MKNKLVLILLTIVTVCITVSCSECINENPPASDEHANDLLSTAEPVYESDTSLDVFLSKLISTENAEVQLNTANGSLKVTPFPVLLSSDFQFYLVENTPHYYIYTFTPILIDGDSKKLSHGERLTIYAAKALEYQRALEIYQLEDQKGYAYNSVDNIWYIDFYGLCILLEFPDGMVLTSPGQIANYFVFEPYYYQTETVADHPVAE